MCRDSRKALIEHVIAQKMQRDLGSFRRDDDGVAAEKQIVESGWDGGVVLHRPECRWDGVAPSLSKRVHTTPDRRHLVWFRRGSNSLWTTASRTSCRGLLFRHGLCTMFPSSAGWKLELSSYGCLFYLDGGGIAQPRRSKGTPEPAEFWKRSSPGSAGKRSVLGRAAMQLAGYRHPSSVRLHSYLAASDKGFHGPIPLRDIEPMNQLSECHCHVGRS